MYVVYVCMSHLCMYFSDIMIYLLIANLPPTQHHQQRKAGIPPGKSDASGGPMPPDASDFPVEFQLKGGGAVFGSTIKRCFLVSGTMMLKQAAFMLLCFVYTANGQGCDAEPEVSQNHVPPLSKS